MKKTLTLLLGLLIIFLYSCGPASDPCENVKCSGHGKCVDGKCNCETGFDGLDCEVDHRCDVITCQNGGECKKGQCHCPEGWEGKECQARATEIWTGTYRAKDSCQKTGRLFYELSIQQSEEDLLRITINNFHGWRDLKSVPDPVEVTARGVTATIDEQVLVSQNRREFVVSGTGSLVMGDSIAIELITEIEAAGQRDSCWCRFEKK